MKRAAGKQVVRGRVYGRFWLGGKERESVPLPAVKADEEHLVSERIELIRDAIEQTLASSRPDKARDIAEQLGAATSAKRIKIILDSIKILSATTGGRGISLFRQHGEQWTSGQLHRRFPDYVKLKKTSQDDVELLEKYVYPLLGNLPVPAVDLLLCEKVMETLPPKLSAARRRHVAQVMSRLLNLAVYPAKLITVSPLPRGYLPKIGAAKAMQYLYPDEDKKLLACTRIPLLARLLYGFLDREGCRLGEAVVLEWSDIDLVRGALTLDQNKTDDPRSWAMDPGVVRALTIWKSRTPGSKGPFVDFEENHAALLFREHHLPLAGIERTDLFTRSATRRPLRVHDLRATFITLSLANGKTETWVADRTGHRSSLMINRYRRAARTLAELNVGGMSPLDETLVWRDDQQTTRKHFGKSDVGSEGPKLTKGRKNKLSGPSGARTRMLSPAADFKSEKTFSDVTIQPKNRQIVDQPHPPPGSFSDGLLMLETDLGEIRWQWTAFEIAVAQMVEDAACQP